MVNVEVPAQKVHPTEPWRLVQYVNLEVAATLGGDPEDGSNDGDYYQDRDRNSTYNREFTLGSPNKIVVPTFSGTQFNGRPYMPFNKAIKEFIKAQGATGLQLLTILQDVDKYGDKQQLQI